MQRHGRGGGTAAHAPRFRVAGLVLLVAYLAVVGWLALRPLPVPWVAPANLQPFATIRADLDEGSLEALARLGRGLARLAPLGVLLPLACGHLDRPLAVVCARTVGAGALISSATVLLQSGVPGRSVNVDAVLLNSAGAGLASLLLFPLIRAWLRRRSARTPGWGGSVHGTGAHDALPLRDETSGGAPPRAARVGIAP
ncbi:VanZ family protein [Streptomyces marispadix]|uniref:VanZ family protein n=1 Tax=Streptomyces marispadix TaxID=2922868 RepID=A0ABS9T127_9ACTN|nr:VanZ family protein [Streptomyces marispadix]MCH6162222.1 VanZ family protein [Streptomyces marispadix]